MQLIQNLRGFADDTDVLALVTVVGLIAEADVNKCDNCCIDVGVDPSRGQRGGVRASFGLRPPQVP